MTQLDTLPAADGGFLITCDADLEQVKQAVADYEQSKWAGGDYGCGPAEPEPAPPPMSSQQLRILADLREREEQAERGEKPPVAWCGLGHQSYEADLEAARKQMLLREKAGQDFDASGETLGEMFGDQAWEAIKEAAQHLREHWQRGYQAGRADALAERNQNL